MFSLPNQPSYRTDYTYSQIFALQFLFNIGLLNALLLLLFIICYIAKKCLARRGSDEQLKESMITQEESSTQVREGQGKPKEIRNKGQNGSRLFKVVNFLTSFFFYCFWVSVSLVYINFYMFGDMGRGTGIDVLSVLAVMSIVAVPTLLWKHFTKTTPWKQLRRELVALIILLTLWLAASVFLVVATKGVCVCFYNNMYGYKISDDVEISSQFSRLNSIDPPCAEGTLCHLYATVPEETSTAVFFNAHAGIDVDSLTFALSLNGVPVGNKTSSSPFKVDNVESIGQRTVHSVLFTDLTANTLYSLEVAGRNGSISKKINYKTVPDASTSELRMAVGGDLGMGVNGQKMCSYLTKYNPDIIILGGDIAYDDAQRNCYYSWDTVYMMFQPVYEQLGRLIPIVMNVGNHDIGFDALSNNQFNSHPEDYPLFFVYNPQHLAHNSQAVPDIADRDGYHYHKVGPTLHLMLDSGYITGFKEQTNFIKLHSISNPSLYRFANYHNPIYPACTNSNPGSNDRLVIDNGLKYWTPLFDELGFIASMEHHTHFRKITHKIKNDLPNNETGTRYIGDGSWGVTEIFCADGRLTPRPELMKDFARSHPNHMWQITITKEAGKYWINYKAINLQEETVFELREQLPDLA